MEAADSGALEPHTDPTSGDICVSGTSDLFPVISSEPCASAYIELDLSSITEFSAADVFRHSPLGNMPNSLKKLSLARDS